MKGQKKNTPATTAAKTRSTTSARPSWVTSIDPAPVAFSVLDDYYGGANSDILGTEHNDSLGSQGLVRGGCRTNIAHMLYSPVGFPVDYVHARPAVKAVPEQHKQGTKVILLAILHCLLASLALPAPPPLAIH